MKLGRKVLSLLAVLALMGTMLSVMAVTTAGAEAINLVVNGDFETNDYTGWLCLLSGSSLSSAWAPTGSFKYKGDYTMTGGGTGVGLNSGLYQFLTVVPGTTYTLTAYAKAYGAADIGFTVIEGGSTSVNDRDRMGNLLQFVWGKHFEPGSNYAGWYDDNDGQPNGLNELGGFYQNYEPDWQKITFDFTPTQSEVLLGFYGYGGWVVYDEISVVKSEAFEFTGVVNGDFECGKLDGWTLNRSDAPMAVGGAHHTGNHGAGNTGSTTWGYYNSGMYQAVGVEPGKTYTVTAYAQSDAGSKTGVAVIEGIGDSVGNNSRLINLSDYIWGYRDGNSDYVKVYNNDVHGKNNGFEELGVYYSNATLNWDKITFDIKPTQKEVVLALVGFNNWVNFDDISIVEKPDVFNGGAELGNLNGWACKANTDTAKAWGVDGSTSHSGKYSFAGGGTGLGYNAGLYQFLTVKPDTIYTLTAYVRANSGTKTYITVLEAFDDSVSDDRLANILAFAIGKNDGSSQYAGYYAENDGKPEGMNELGNYSHNGYLGWEKVTIDFTASREKVLLGIDGRGDWIWVDDISVSEKEFPPVTGKIINGDFELNSNKLPGWSAINNEIVAPGTETDSYYVRTTTGRNGHGLAACGVSNPLYQEVAVVAGQTYFLDAWVKWNEGAAPMIGVAEGAGKTALEVLSALPTILGGDAGDGSVKLLGVYAPEDTVSDWTKVRFTITPAQNKIVLALLNAGTAEACFDDFALLPIGVVNGGFEDGVWDGWQTNGVINDSGDAGTYWKTSDRHSGNLALGCKDVTDPFYQDVYVVPEQQYIVTAWVKGGAAGTKIAVKQGDAELGSFVLTDAYADWTQVAFDFTATQDQVRLELTNPTNVDARFDDIAFTEEKGLVNGKFDDGLNGWNADVQTWNPMKWTAHTPEGGDNPMLRSEDYNNRPIYQTLHLVPGRIYTLTLLMTQSYQSNPGADDLTAVGVFEREGKTPAELASAAFNYLKGNSADVDALGSHTYHKVKNWNKITFDFTPTQTTCIVAFVSPSAVFAFIDNITITEKGTDTLNVLDSSVLKSDQAGILEELDENNKQGLRFIHELTTTVGDNGETVTFNGDVYTVKSVGVLVVAGEYKDENGRVLDLEVAHLNEENKKIANNTVTTCRSITDGEGTRTYTFTAITKNISQANKDKDLSCRAYLTCEDADGKTVVLYGSVATTNVLEMYNTKNPSDFADGMAEWMEVE